MSDPGTAVGKSPAGGVLVVDDEFSVRDSLAGWFKKDGYHVATAADAMEALRRLQEHSWDVVLLDIRMPGMDGIELQRRIHEIDPELIVIMITAFASVETAVRALKEGAFDYVTKPIDPDELSRLVAKGMQHRQARKSREGEREDERSEDSTAIVAGCAAMRRALELAVAAAASDIPVTLRGEAGTGKELLARFIHSRGERRNFPFVPVRCGALPEESLASELLGHDRLSFAGARFRRKGRLEMANGGTLLLKEIESMAPRLQIDLLHLLDTGEFVRLGGGSPVEVDLRLMAATDQDLEALVRAGRFREDLYYRLNVLSIAVPPLRDRRDDIPDLSRQLLRSASRRMKRPFSHFDPAATDALVRHDWPHNVNELIHAIEQALVVGTPPVVHSGDLSLTSPSEPAH